MRQNSSIDRVAIWLMRRQHERVQNQRRHAEISSSGYPHNLAEVVGRVLVLCGGKARPRLNCGNGVAKIQPQR
jgi:hypothetical protein